MSLYWVPEGVDHEKRLRNGGSKGSAYAWHKSGGKSSILVIVGTVDVYVIRG